MNRGLASRDRVEDFAGGVAPPIDEGTQLGLVERVVFVDIDPKFVCTFWRSF